MAVPLNAAILPTAGGPAAVAFIGHANERIRRRLIDELDLGARCRTGVDSEEAKACGKQGDGEHVIDALDHRTFLLRIVCRIADAPFSHIAPERRVK
jgi:hypothetical protein